MQVNLVQRLRDRAYAFKAPDPLVEEAAAEIERLRITDAEREAVGLAYSRLTTDTHYATVAATLRGLLDRTELRREIGSA